MTANGESMTGKEKNQVRFLVDTKFKSDNAYVTFLLKEVDLNNTHLQFSDFVFFQNHEISHLAHSHIAFTAKQEMLMMTFCLKGECCIHHSINLSISEYHLKHLISGETVIAQHKPEDHVLYVFIDKDFISTYITYDISNKIIAAYKPSHLKIYSIGAKILSTLFDMINCEFDGYLKKLFTKAKIIELLSFHIAQIKQQKQAETAVLRAGDFEKMLTVKHLISEQPHANFSLSTLAKEVGTNEQYLKKHFKIAFGTTVFGYINSSRMEKAKEMILQGEYNISEVALLSGYKHATHFTAAFKKYFGYLPLSIKGK